MADKLTYEQQMAVDDRGGMLLVSAAAGSGKTKVLVDRLMKYLNDPVSPANLDEFLIITYTKAAASELRGKIAAKLTEKIAENTHENWAQARIREGWIYGPERSDEKKTHPCLIPYGQLPDSEKEYDRRTAMETLKLVVALGYKISKDT